MSANFFVFRLQSYNNFLISTRIGTKMIATYAEHKWRSCFITPVGAIFLRSASDLQVDAGEEGAWGGRAIHIACIAIHALIEVGLETVEQVLNACVDLQRVVLV